MAKKNGDDNIESLFSYGADVDVTTTDPDEPQGETAAWMPIINAHAKMLDAASFIFKVMYLLVIRGKEQKTTNKNLRIKYKQNTVEQGPRLFYITFPTGTTSVKGGELTPGRFRTLYCGAAAGFFKEKKIISPLLTVIGFKLLVEKYGDIAAQLKEALEGKDGAYKEDYEQYIAGRAKIIYPGSENAWSVITGLNAAQIPDAWSGTSYTDVAFVWLFACMPDRVPVMYGTMPMLAELGAALNLMQDARSMVMASVQQGTAAEKKREKSQFFNSYKRRTESMGIPINPKMLELWVKTIFPVMEPGIQIETALPEAVRAFTQEMVDRLVSGRSKNAAMRF